VMEKMEAESLPDLIHQAMRAGMTPPDRARVPDQRPALDRGKLT